MNIQDFIKESEREFKERFPCYSNGIIAENTTDFKTWHTLQQQKLLEKVVEMIQKQIIIHTQLANEWTGISLKDKEVHSINPHIEKIEELEKVIKFISQNLN